MFDPNNFKKRYHHTLNCEELVTVCKQYRRTGRGAVLLKNFKIWLSLGLTAGVETVLKLPDQLLIFSIFLLSVCSDGIKTTSTSYNATKQQPSDDSDYYILNEENDFMAEPSFVRDKCSVNVSVSTGSRAYLHCTIENASRKTVRKC